MISFAANSIATQTEVDAERMRLGRLLWPARLAKLIGIVLALYAGFQGSKEIVPLLVGHFYGPEWPNGNTTLLDVMMLGMDYVLVFFAIAMPLLQALNNGFHTYLFGPFRRLAELGPGDAAEAVRLAENWPAIESYRLAVARCRRFVIGDLELMRQIDTDEHAKAFERKREEVRKADLMRLGSTR